MGRVGTRRFDLEDPHWLIVHDDSVSNCAVEVKAAGFSQLTIHCNCRSDARILITGDEACR
jgi:hypothetical protein